MEGRKIKFKVIAKGPDLHKEFEGQAEASEDTNIPMIAAGTLGALANEHKLAQQITEMTITFKMI